MNNPDYNCPHCGSNHIFSTDPTKPKLKKCSSCGGKLTDENINLTPLMKWKKEHGYE
jgi:DNA-directed RNA polymerase subunit RPC12/RpoP